MAEVPQRNTHASPEPTGAGSRLQALFDPECVTDDAVPSLVDDQLFPEERAHIKQSVPKRRAEFGTARVCARRALARLEIDPQPLVPTPDRAPIWPPGIVGSISHTKRYCAVVVGRASRFRSLGLDVEEDRELEPALIEMICTPRERRILATRTARDAILYFAAKEAFYKCQYPLTRVFLDFQDVELDVDFSGGTFQSRVLKPINPTPTWLDQLSGRFSRHSGLWLCGVTLKPGLGS